MNKFTVVIPTRERPDTLLHTLKTCVDQDYENLTILVSDNCSADNTEEVVRSLNDKRIRYVRTPGRLSMTSNYDFALDHVEGGYMNIIGDDDGLIPNSLNLVNNILNECPADAIHSKNKAIYFWPEYLEEELKGEFQLSLKPTYRVLPTRKCFLQSVKELRDVFLPQLYHGYVKTDIIQKLKREHGTFFNGSSPDIYASVVLGKVLSRHIYSEYPLTIHGLSHHSIGTSNRLNYLDNSPAAKFWSESPLPFHEKLVMISSSTIVYADAFMQAKKFIPDFPAIEMKDVITLAVKESMLVKDSHNRGELIKAIRGIAEKNQLNDFTESMLARSAYPSRTESRRSFGFNPANEMLVLKTHGLGVLNVYDAFLLAGKLLHENIYHFSRRPLNEPITEHFRRGIKSLLKKFIR